MTRNTNSPLRVCPGEFYRNQIKAIKPFLPKDHKKIVLDLFPEYKSPEGQQLYMNVLSGQSCCIKLTGILSQVANNNKKPVQAEISIDECLPSFIPLEIPFFSTNK